MCKSRQRKILANKKKKREIKNQKSSMHTMERWEQTWNGLIPCIFCELTSIFLFHYSFAAIFTIPRTFVSLYSLDIQWVLSFHTSFHSLLSQTLHTFCGLLLNGLLFVNCLYKPLEHFFSVRVECDDARLA